MFFSFIDSFKTSEVRSFIFIAVYLLKGQYFQGLLAAMVKDLNVVRATNKQGLIANLENLQKELTLCEKALADYLETKRLIYPRFYFVSSADLLDILSNGNQPDLVAK